MARISTRSPSSGISAVFDMRTAAERDAEPDVVPDGTEQVVCDVLKDSQEHFRAAGGNPRLLEPVLGVDADYLRTALDEMTQKYSSIEGYFGDGLGIATDTQHGLRDTLVRS